MATRILIADDHEMMRTVLRNLINSHHGWQVCAEAKNGGEAVAQAKELRPDLIILDLAMPVMDGIRAAREITKTDPAARMIMFTLHASPEVEEQAKRVGVKRVVSKAKNGGRLVRAIEQTLGGQSEETRAENDFPTQDVRETNEADGGIRVRQPGAKSNDGTTPEPARKAAVASAVETSRTDPQNPPSATEGAKQSARDLPAKDK